MVLNLYCAGGRVRAVGYWNSRSLIGSEGGYTSRNTSQKRSLLWALCVEQLHLARIAMSDVFYVFFLFDPLPFVNVYPAGSGSSLRHKQISTPVALVTW